MPDRYLSERSLLLRSKKNKWKPDNVRPMFTSTADLSSTSKEPPSATIKEVVKMRIILDDKKDDLKPTKPLFEASNSVNADGCAQDVAIEVKPVQFHVDFFTFQRLENCLLAVMGSGQKDPITSSRPVKGHVPGPQHPVDQQIFDDLEGTPRAVKVRPCGHYSYIVCVSAFAVVLTAVVPL
jgi:hypothetical protein